jgi:predicted permease
MWSEVLIRVRALFRRKAVEGELDEELRFHLERQVEKYVRGGLSREAAKRRAWMEFGGLEQAKEKCRDARGVQFLDTLLQDMRYGSRMLGKSPGFTAVAVITLALGIGVNTTIFSVVSALLLRKPPVQDPDRVMVISSSNPAKDAYAPDRTPASALDYLDWRAQSRSFSNMTAAVFDDFTLSGGMAPQRVAAARVSSSFFKVLGVSPALGREILPEEDRPGGDKVVVLSDGLWKERFGGDPRVVGSLVKINGVPFTVVGVMPNTFRLWDFQAQLWVPLVFSADDLRPAARSWRWLLVFARLKPDTEVRQATAEMQLIAHRLAQAHKDTNEGWGASVKSLQRYSIADSNAQTATAFLMAAVAFVLLIACTNLANLLLSRNSAREREFTIRSALGAGRFRLARQLFTECLLLSVSGGVLGTLGAFWGVAALRSQFNWNEYAQAMAKEVSVDGLALQFTVGISLAAGILFGLAPAMEIARRRASNALKEGSRGATTGPERLRLQRLLVVGQLALSLFLLVGAGLFVEGFLEEVRASVGFDSHNLLTASVSLRGLPYLQPQRQKQFFEDALRRVAALPGVESGAVTTDLPFSFPGRVSFMVEGLPITKPQERPKCGWFGVSPGHFATLQVPLLQGREFTSSDSGDAPPVVVVNEAFVRRYFGTTSALGRHIRLDLGDQDQDQWREVVGVAGNVREFLGQVQPRPEIFVPFATHPNALMRFIVRTRTDPASLSDGLRRAVWAIDPDQAVTEIRTMDRVIADSSEGDDLMAGMMGGFAFLALLMAAVGIFGVLSYLVEQRTQEMGIRLALGAEPGALLRLVIRKGMALVGVGAGIGVLLSLALPKLVAMGFDNFTFHSAWVLVIAPIVVLLAGFAACYMPARRAMRVDPMVALRYE